MTRSANEVQTLIAKAARGAGVPAGQAAAFGQAAVRHLSAGRPEQDLIAALDALPEGPVLAIPLALSRLIETADTDTAQGILSFGSFDGLAQSYSQALPYHIDCAETDAGLQITLTLTRPAARREVMRLTLSEGFTTVLTTLLAKTLVPDTAASRLAGAGAGLTDND